MEFMRSPPFPRRDGPGGDHGAEETVHVPGPADAVTRLRGTGAPPDAEIAAGERGKGRLVAGAVAEVHHDVGVVEASERPERAPLVHSAGKKLGHAPAARDDEALLPGSYGEAAERGPEPRERRRLHCAVVDR